MRPAIGRASVATGGRGGHLANKEAGLLRINAAHGGGGQLMNGLIRDIFLKHFANDTLAALEDAAVLPASGQKKPYPGRERCRHHRPGRFSAGGAAFLQHR